MGFLTTTPGRIRALISSLLTTFPQLRRVHRGCRAPGCRAAPCFIAPQLAPGELKSKRADADSPSSIGLSRLRTIESLNQRPQPLRRLSSITDWTGARPLAHRKGARRFAQPLGECLQKS